MSEDIGTFLFFRSTSTYQDLRYGYDPGGNVTALVDPIFGTQSFRYDDLDRLISATGPYGTGGATATRTYGYDQIGNLTLHCTLGDLAYPASGVGAVGPHRVCATGTTSCAAPTYQYDLNGNLTSNPALSSLAYDFENRPTSITKSGVSTTMAYHDLLGRVTKTVSGTTTTYVGPFYECTGGTCTKYIFAGDFRIAMKSGTTVAYFHGDHLSSASVLTNGSDGSKNEQITYFPFGQTRTDTDGAGNPLSPGVRYKYTDQEFDDSTGLYYYKARYYDPALGRFIQPDPIVPDLYEPQSLNPYSYVLNNPLRYVDPMGLQEEPPILLPPIEITAAPIPPNLGLSSFLFATTTPRFEIFAPSAGPGFAVSASVTVVPQAAHAPAFPSVSLPQPSFLDIASTVLLPVGLARGIASAIVGRDIESGAAVSPLELPIIIATQGKGSGGIGRVASGALGNVKFLSAKEIAKRLGVSREVFHRDVKQDIIKEFNAELKNLGTKNPEIGVDALGNIVLRNTRTGQSISTNVPLGSFLP